MPETVDIKGFAELESALKALPDRVAKKIAQQSMRKGAVVIQRDAKSRVARLTGNLRANIVVRLRRRQSTAPVTYSIGWTTKAFYGSFLEFGTRFMRARPFLRPAADESFGEVVSTIGRDMGPRLVAEFKRLMGR